MVLRSCEVEVSERTLHHFTALSSVASSDLPGHPPGVRRRCPARVYPESTLAVAPRSPDCPGGHRTAGRPQEATGRPRRPQDCREATGGHRRPQDGPGGHRTAQDDLRRPGGHRRPQEATGGHRTAQDDLRRPGRPTTARRPQDGPGGHRTAQDGLRQPGRPTPARRPRRPCCAVAGAYSDPLGGLPCCPRAVPECPNAQGHTRLGMAGEGYGGSWLRCAGKPRRRFFGGNKGRPLR
jgi:hypothetical protein